MGLYFRYDGASAGPIGANSRFFGNQRGRLVFELESGWIIHPLLVGPKFELRPLQLDKDDFKIAMLQLGVPEETLEMFINDQYDFPTDISEY